MAPPHAIVKIPIYGDGTYPAGYLPMRGHFLDALKVSVGLDVLWPEAVSMYACDDGPVLVLQGEKDGRLSIKCVTPDVAELNPKSAMLVKWKACRGRLKISDVHSLILTVLGQKAN